MNAENSKKSLDMRKHGDPKCCSNWKQTAERCPKVGPSFFFFVI